MHARLLEHYDPTAGHTVSKVLVPKVVDVQTVLTVRLESSLVARHWRAVRWAVSAAGPAHGRHADNLPVGARDEAASALLHPFSAVSKPADGVVRAGVLP